MIENCNFSYKHYKNTLKEIKKTHNFVTYSNCSNNDIILRHDVDTSLLAALNLAKIENELEVSSTYFIYFSSEFYNPFGQESSKIISKILELGHKIGLHYNEDFITQHELEPSDTIAKEIQFFEHHFKTEMDAIAAHEANSFPPSLQIKIPGIFNAYSNEFVHERKYLSDSAQYWREGCFCQHYQHYDKLQVLIHPMWWTHDNKSRSQVMHSYINGEYDTWEPLVKSDKIKHEEWAETISKNDPRIKT